METVAIYYEGTTVYWSGIIMAAGILAGFLVSLSLYVPRNKYGYGFCIYFPIAMYSALIFSRMFHWYCYKEQYESMSIALKDYTKGGFLMPGVLLGLWITALLLAPLTKKCSRFDILDPLAPGLALIIAIIKYCDRYSDLCRGKLIISNEKYCRLPYAVLTSEGNYRFATFFVTFMLMLCVFVILLFFYYLDSRLEKRKYFDNKGHVFRIFLVLYGAVEIVMDSTRYDAAHFYFPGEALAVLNKGTGFMGFSQLIGALCCLGIFIYYLIISAKISKWNRKHTISLIVFVLGLAMGATSEYLVQRYFGYYKYWYLIQSVGVIMIVVSIFMLYFSGTNGFKIINTKENIKKETEKNIKETEKKINFQEENDDKNINTVSDETLNIIDLDETQNIYKL